jgi:hypothetical protein
MVVLMLVGTGCYEVVYTAEYKGASCIKFEDALYDQNPDPLLEDWLDACLGEDGVEEADEFFVTLDSECDEVDVSIKAGKCKEDATLVWDPDEGLWVGYACGFTIAGFPDGDAWDLVVVSDTDNETAALSDVTFCFCDDVTVVDPPEGPYAVLRGSEYDEPTEPDED